MKRIDVVYNKLKEIAVDGGITTKELAQRLGLSRANVSNDLNKLWKKGKICKGEGRPVLYYIAEEEKQTIFDELVKECDSLVMSVEQAEAAILYPPRGMHTLILGETGVGKTMFAGLMHRYAIEMDMLTEEAPFITFNCADYCSNPQLLISQLFGVKKGAYTGADSDQIGLIERANGGMLFLDEVHRLPAEGQEMFFTFMDKGVYRRLGETNEERTADVFIISATTENPESSLLKTFTRRIPMIIKLPPLKERGMRERFNLISKFFRAESSRLNKPIKVSANSLRAFLTYNCPNNIGQLKTDVKLACAKAYTEYVSRREDKISIHSPDLPSYIKKGLYNEKEHRHIWNELIGINHKYCIFDHKQGSLISDKQKKNDNIYELIENRINELRIKGIEEDEIERIMEKDIQQYYTRCIHGADRGIKKTNLTSIVEPYIIELVEEIVRYSEERLKKTLSERVFLGMVLHISTSVDRIKRGKNIINPQLNKIRTKYKKEFLLAFDCIRLIEERLDVKLPIDEAGFLTMFFVLDESERKKEQETVGVIVITHGSTGATSMVDVTNNLLGVNYAVGINAPLDVKPQDVLNKVRQYIKDYNRESDFIFLVDMGSLTTFGEVIEKEFETPIKTVTFVSTPHVIEATRKAMLGYSLDEIYRDVTDLVSYVNNTEIEIDNKDKLKLAIVTVCLTGEGSALAMKNHLCRHLDIKDDILEIIPMNLIDKDSIGPRLDRLQKEKEIVCVISSFSINTNIPQYTLVEVLNLTAINKIQSLVEINRTYYKMGRTLKYHLKNVDETEVFPDVKRLISDIEHQLNVRLDKGVLVGAALHISCMIDRLKKDSTVDQYIDKEKYIKENQGLYYMIRTCINFIEEKYKIEIVDDEICYIMNFFHEDNQKEY